MSITANAYSHLSPTAFEADFVRLSFVVPTERARVASLVRDEQGRVMGRTAIRAV